VKLTTYFHITTRLRMCGAILIIPLHSFMAWTGIALHFFVRELRRLSSFGSAEQISPTDLLKDLCGGVSESLTCLIDGWKARVIVWFWSGLVTHTAHGQSSVNAVPLCDLSL
jgi:hypothetical protein